MPWWRRTPLRGALALAIYTAWALAYLRPIWRIWAGRITPDRVDALFTLYVLRWSSRQIRLGLPDLWNANFFYPTRGVFTFADHLLGPALQLVLLRPFVPGDVAAYNVLFFTSFVLSGLATAWVLRRSGCSLPAALLAGGIYAFSPFRLMHANHVQILLAQWIPLTLWAWDRLLAEPTARRAALFLPLYLLHLSGSCYLAYMIHVPLLVLLLNRLFAPGGRALLSRRALAVLTGTAAVALGAAAALFTPYVRNAARLGLARDPEEVVRYGATLASYLAPSPRHVLGHLLYAPWGIPRAGLWKAALFRAENTLFAGILGTALAAWGAAVFWRRYRERPALSLGTGRRVFLAALLAAAAAALVAGDVLTLRRGLTAEPDRAELALFLPLGVLFFGALVPWLLLRRRWGGGWPLRLAAIDPWERGLALSGIVCLLLSFPVVYLPLMRVVPGLDGMRVPARFYAFLSLTLALFAARGLDGIVARVRPSRRALAWSAAALLLFVDLLPSPLRWVPVLSPAEFPAVYHWVAAEPTVRALLEVPVRPRAGDMAYMYFSTLHWKPIANGYSGYQPPSYLEILQRARFLPAEDGLALLRRLGVSHLVVHTADLAPRHGRKDRAATAELVQRWEKRFLGREVVLAYVSGPDRVYRILGARILEARILKSADPLSARARAARSGPAGGSRRAG